MTMSCVFLLRKSLLALKLRALDLFNYYIQKHVLLRIIALVSKQNLTRYYSWSTVLANQCILLY